MRWNLLSLPVLVAAAGSPAFSQTVHLVSRSSGGSQGNGASMGELAMSSDARYVVFRSSATNLGPGPDTNGLGDLFLRDRLTATTERVSLGATGAQPNGLSGRPSVSADGRFVVFESVATNLLAGADLNGADTDVFLRDRPLGATILISQSSAGIQGNDHSYDAAISSDGRFVAFSSGASNLVASDANGVGDVFVVDLVAGTVEIASLSTSGAQGNANSDAPAISPDGRYVAFVSQSTNLSGAPDANGFHHDVFVRDRLNQTTELVTVSTAGIQADDLSYGPAMSADGRFVAFYTQATNLGGAQGPSPWFYDVYVRDRLAGTTDLVSRRNDGTPGNAPSDGASISADGRYVAFASNSTNLSATPDYRDPDDPSPSYIDVFLHDRVNGTTELASLGASGAQGNAVSYDPVLSDDGLFVAFWSNASNLTANDVNAATDVFVRELTDPPVLAWCFSSSFAVQCPCGNVGLAERGCQNSAGTGGARLFGSGAARRSADTLVLTTSGELPSSLTIFFQGNGFLYAPYGDGARCAGGSLKRLYVKTASAGSATAPQPGDPSITARSAALGDPNPLGSTRPIQAYYRDGSASFCPSPTGSTFNATNAVSPFWRP